MTYQLTFITPEPKGVRAVGENVFLPDLPQSSRVFVFYYPAAVPDDDLEERLRALGSQTGGNLFVNIGRWDDPSFDKIVTAFSIRTFPVIIVTANHELASADDEAQSAFVCLDRKAMMSDSVATVNLVQEIWTRFLVGDVKGAVRNLKKAGRDKTVHAITDTLLKGAKGLGQYIATRDISVSLTEGKLEIARSPTSAAGG